MKLLINYQALLISKSEFNASGTQGKRISPYYMCFTPNQALLV